MASLSNSSPVNTGERKRYSRKTLLDLRKSKLSSIKPENFNEPDYGKSDPSQARDSSIDRSSLSSSSTYGGRGRRNVEQQGDRAERGGKRGETTFFKTGSFDQRQDTNWENKRRNETKIGESRGESRRGNQRTTSEGQQIVPPVEKKKKDLWTLGSLAGSSDLTREELERREEFEKFRRQHSAGGDKAGTADAILAPQTETQPKNHNSGGSMFMSSDFFSNLTIGDDETDMDPLANFNPDMLVRRKTSSLLFADTPGNVNSIEKDLLQDLRLDDKLGSDVDVPFNPEQMFADILGMDQSSSMPPTPTHVFNTVPEAIFYKPPMHTGPGMTLPGDMLDLASIEGELLPKGSSLNKVDQSSTQNFDINNLFNVANFQQERQHTMMPMMPMMPQHLLTNNPPYMNVPYNPSSFPPPQTQQFVDPYHEYLLQQQQLQSQQPQQLQQSQQPQQAQRIQSFKQETKAKVKRQNMVPPQLQKQLGKTITEISPTKEESKGAKNKKTTTKQTLPQNMVSNQPLQVQSQTEFIQQQLQQQAQFLPHQQESLSNFQKWFGPNISVDSSIQTGPHIMPQNAMSLEEIEASLVNKQF